MNRIVSRFLLASLVFCAGWGQAPRAATGQDEAARPSQQASPAGQTATDSGGAQELEDVEDLRGPLTLAGQDFTVVLHYKRLPGKSGPDSRALTSLEIRDATGEVQHQESFPYAVEEGVFSEACSAGIRLLPGRGGTGLLVESGCWPSAPLTGGPWQVFGVVGGKLLPFGKPLVTEGESAEFVPGAVERTGNLTQILPDVLRIRVWTGYFFVSVLVRINWLEGTLALGQRCMYQTGHGPAEEGCEMPVDEARVAPREQEMTFVRLFRESNERNGPPAHVVVRADSKVEVVAGKVLIIWSEGSEAVYLCVGEDVWVKVRIDGQEGWIHTQEDLNAIGLFAAG